MKTSMFPLLTALAIVFSACGGGTSNAAPTEHEPETVDTADSTEPTEPTEPTAPVDGESCYVVSVDEEEGCWGSGDEACNAVCGGPCTCTEATSRNTCGC